MKKDTLTIEDVAAQLEAALPYIWEMIREHQATKLNNKKQEAANA